MIALRSALFLAILIVFTPFYWAMVMLSGPFSRLARYRVIAGWPRFATWLARALLGIDYEVHGRDNIPREPCVILSKHQSAWETIAYTSIFPPHVYVIKRELLWIPFLGWGLGLMSPIAIDRADRKRAMQRMTELGGKRFKQGFSIMVYPEGTRVAVGRRGTYQLGGAGLAVSDDVDFFADSRDQRAIVRRNPRLSEVHLLGQRTGRERQPRHPTADAGAGGIDGAGPRRQPGQR